MRRGVLTLGLVASLTALDLDGPVTQDEVLYQLEHALSLDLTRNLSRATALSVVPHASVAHDGYRVGVRVAFSYWK